MLPGTLKTKQKKFTHASQDPREEKVYHPQLSGTHPTSNQATEILLFATHCM